jgi:hypothetical protein
MHLAKKHENPRLTADLSKETDQELLEGLRRSLGLFAEALIDAARRVAECDRRGISLESVRIDFLAYLRQIAAGSLSAAALVHFIDKKNVLTRIAQLSIVEQERLAGGEKLPVCLGREDHVMIDPLEMSAAQLALVFGAGRLRSVEEQRASVLASEPRAVPVRTAITIHLSEDEYEVISAKAVASGESVPTCLVRECRKKKII